MAYLGMLVIAGHRFPVTRLAIRGGRLEIHAAATGPFPAFADEPVTVFGEDGAGMVQGGRFTSGGAGPGEIMSWFITLSWDKTTDEGVFSD